MTAAVIALAIALGGVSLAAVIAIVSMSRRGSADADARIADADERAKLTVESERAKFEAANAVKAFNNLRDKSAGLETYVASQALTTDPNADLALDDLAGRELRAYRRSVAAGASGDPLRPAADATVLVAPTEASTGRDALLRPE